MIRFLSLLLVCLMILGSLAGCQTEKDTAAPTTATESTAPTEPQIIIPTGPVSTEPEPTAPPTEIPPQGALMNNMICTVTYGDGTQKVVENPLVSHIYNYLIAERSSSEEKRPSDNRLDYMDSMITLHFQVNEKSALMIYIWSDGYAAIATNASDPNSACRYYKFSDGVHASVLLTLKNN